MARKGRYEYDYPRPMVTVDIAVFRTADSARQILLIQRGSQPFKDHWALPGGFVEIDENLPDAAARELAEETNLTGLELQQLATFGKPGRDPRGRTISVVYLTTLGESTALPKAASDAGDAKWFDIENLPDKLAFDHRQIIQAAIKKLDK